MTEPLAGCHTLQCALFAAAANANTQTATHTRIVDYQRHCDAEPGRTGSRKSHLKKDKTATCVLKILVLPVLDLLNDAKSPCVSLKRHI